jgi:hypothetical protein
MYLRSFICESVSISCSVNLQVTIFFHVGPWDAGVTKKLDTRGEVNLHASDYTKKPSGGVHQMAFFIYIHITYIYISVIMIYIMIYIMIIIYYYYYILLLLFLLILLYIIIIYIIIIIKKIIIYYI